MPTNTRQIPDVKFPCVICGEAGDPAVSKDYRVGKLVVTVGFTEDGKAAGSVPLICKSCQATTVKTAVSD